MWKYSLMCLRWWICMIWSSCGSRMNSMFDGREYDLCFFFVYESSCLMEFEHIVDIRLWIHCMLSGRFCIWRCVWRLSVRYFSSFSDFWKHEISEIITMDRDIPILNSMFHLKTRVVCLCHIPEALRYRLCFCFPNCWLVGIRIMNFMKFRIHVNDDDSVSWW